MNYFVLQDLVVMGTQAVSTYQQVIEKTKGLAFRSQMLVMNIEKKLAPKPEVSPSDVIRLKLKLCGLHYCRTSYTLNPTSLTRNT